MIIVSKFHENPSRHIREEAFSNYENASSPDQVALSPDQVALISLYQESEVLIPSHFTIMPS